MAAASISFKRTLDDLTLCAMVWSLKTGLQPCGLILKDQTGSDTIISNSLIVNMNLEYSSVDSARHVEGHA